MNYQETIDSRRLELLQENIQDIRDNKNYYLEKISRLQSRNPDLNFDGIYQDAINGNDYAIALLRKDSKKQNITENCFFEYTGLKKAPASGKNAVRFNDSKSADFVIGDYYGTQKYIQDCGGAQDNQVNDAVYFANEAAKLGKKSIICIDGEYGKKAIARKKIPQGCIVLTADELKQGIIDGRFN